MATFGLIPGAGGVAWYWHRVVPLLEQAGHAAIAVELPGEGDFSAYADRVVEALRGRREVVIVAQSLAGFTAPLVCERVPVQMLVFLNAMIPLPHERAGAWGDAVGSNRARIDAARRGGYREEFDDETYFLHDIPEDLAPQMPAHQRDQAEDIFKQECAFDGWPDVPIRVIASRDDRLFPLELQRRVARERLGLEVEVIPGGHLAALSRPHELVERLLSWL